MTQSGKSFLFIVTLLFLAGWVSRAKAQFTLGARNASLNYAVTAMPENNWALYGNPALLPESENLFSFYSIRYYEIPAFTHLAATGVYQLPVGTMALGTHTFGDDNYRESNISLAYRYIYANFYVSTAVRYYHLAFGGVYGSSGALGVDIGLASKVNEHISIGGKIVNLNRPTVGENEEELPRSLSMGASFLIGERVRLNTDVVKDVRFPLGVRGGLEIKVIEAVDVRVGAGIRPYTMSFGAGFHLKQWTLDIAAERHEFLGWSPGINASYSW